MKVINKNMRALRKQVADASKNVESLTLLHEMQQKALEAKSFDPIKLAQQNGDGDKDKFRVEFRKGIHQFLGGMFDLEIALLSGDNKKANELYRALGKLKSPSHKQFKAKK